MIPYGFEYYSGVVTENLNYNFEYYEIDIKTMKNVNYKKIQEGKQEGKKVCGFRLRILVTYFIQIIIKGIYIFILNKIFF